MGRLGIYFILFAAILAVGNASWFWGSSTSSRSYGDFGEIRGHDEYGRPIRVRIKDAEIIPEEPSFTGKISDFGRLAGQKLSDIPGKTGEYFMPSTGGAIRPESHYPEEYSQYAAKPGMISNLGEKLGFHHRPATPVQAPSTTEQLQRVGQQAYELGRHVVPQKAYETFQEYIQPQYHRPQEKKAPGFFESFLETLGLRSRQPSTAEYMAEKIPQYMSTARQGVQSLSILSRISSMIYSLISLPFTLMRLFMKSMLYLGLALGSGYLLFRTMRSRTAKRYMPRSASPNMYPVYKKGEIQAVSSIDAEKPVKYAQEGPASMEAFTIPALLKRVLDKCPNEQALRFERDGIWHSWSWKQYSDRINGVSRSLIQLGVKPYDVVNLLGHSSPEFFAAYLAAIQIGAVPGPIYSKINSDSSRNILQNARSKVLFVDDEEQLRRVVKGTEEFPELDVVVKLSGTPEIQGRSTEFAPEVMLWDEFLQLGKEVSITALDGRIASLKPSRACSIVYTSGTTGEPKSILLSHDNLTWTSKASLDLTPKGFGDREERMVTYLPLNHVATQVMDIVTPIVLSSFRPGNCVVYFARPDALAGSLVETLRQVKPTAFFAVPRVWEKLRETVERKAQSKQDSMLEKMLWKWSQNIGLSATKSGEVGAFGMKPLLYPFAKWLVFDQVARELGLDACKHCSSGAAPLLPETSNFFAGFNIVVKELFGLTETSGMVASCTESVYKLGSCGIPLEGTEIKIDHHPERDLKNQGEILVRGRNVMMGYLNQPDKTFETIDDEGWLHTGDVGYLDKDGLLFVSGRLKDIIVTAGGEKLAPEPIEHQLRTLIPGVNHVVVLGDKKRFNVALFTLETMLRGDGRHSKELAPEAAKVSDSKTVDEAAKDPKWRQHIQKGIDKYNDLATSHAHKILNFAILPTSFSIESGEVTPLVRLRRDIISKKYNSIIDELYAAV